MKKGLFTDCVDCFMYTSCTDADMVRPIDCSNFIPDMNEDYLDNPESFI